jgi:hypothetical protein
VRFRREHSTEPPLGRVVRRRVRHVEPDPEPFADRAEELGPVRLLGVIPRAEVDEVLAVLVERHRGHADAAADPEQQWLDALAVGAEALDAAREQRVCERRGLTLPTGRGPLVRRC